MCAAAVDDAIKGADGLEYWFRFVDNLLET